MAQKLDTVGEIHKHVKRVFRLSKYKKIVCRVIKNYDVQFLFKLILFIINLICVHVDYFRADYLFVAGHYPIYSMLVCLFIVLKKYSSF